MASNFESQHSMESGFDCEILTPSMTEIQTECPLCHKIIRNPYTVTCCCDSFCKKCIEPIKAASEPCPKCREENFILYEDKRLKRSLYVREVRCSQQGEGCEWTGELGQLDNHLNKDPRPEKQLEGCQYVKITCTNCENKMQRKDIEKHQNTTCTNLPFTCKYCNEYKSTFNNVMNNHWPVCGSFPLSCPNKCSSTIQRQNIDSHIANECPLTTINCDFHHVGCTVKLLRQDMVEHLRENLTTHVSLLATSHAKQKEKITKLEDENDFQKSKFENLEQNYKSLETINRKLQVEMNALKEGSPIQITHQPLPQISIPLCPPLLTMVNIEHKKGDFWFSPPVYTHPQGYKICLKVEIVPWGNQSHQMTTYIHFMKGQFDDFLTWPFKGAISIRIVDQVKGQGHREFKSKYTTDNECCQRVVSNEIARHGQEAINTIIYDGNDTSKFHKNDTIVFHIYEVEFY